MYVDFVENFFLLHEIQKFRPVEDITVPFLSKQSFSFSCSACDPFSHELITLFRASVEVHFPFAQQKDEELVA